MRRSAYFRNPDAVTNRTEFGEFVGGLLQDLHENYDDWENPTLALFLEAMAAYTEAAPGAIAHNRLSIDPDKPSWQLFALILAGARVYE